jgi:hypothetical protein
LSYCSTTFIVLLSCFTSTPSFLLFYCSGFIFSVRSHHTIG